MTRHPIRNGRPDDLETLREIEVSAGKVFADYGMPEIAEDEPPSIEFLAGYCEDQRLWVATDESDRPVAYLIAEVVDGCAHIEQVSVHADHAGKRIGQDLIARLIDWARKRNLPAVTLTTFSEIPWNAPYYERLGFETVPESGQSPGLKHIRREESERHLERWPRVCMRLNISYVTPG